MKTNYNANVLLCSLLLAAPIAGVAQERYGQSRGELLYGTYCDNCHTTEVHWREKKQATDRASLAAQVRRWQANGGLVWTDADVAEVARYLDARFYHFPPEIEGPGR